MDCARVYGWRICICDGWLFFCWMLFLLLWSMIDATLLYVVIFIILVMAPLLHDDICDLWFVPLAWFYSYAKITHLYYGVGSPRFTLRVLYYNSLVMVHFSSILLWFNLDGWLHTWPRVSPLYFVWLKICIHFCQLLYSFSSNLVHH